jgi:T-complex protein 1 subunit theta
MSMKQVRAGAPSLTKQGSKTLTGNKEVLYKNIEACRALSTITRTSFGPNGMHKMVINRHDRLFVTADAATIISELEVEHPAAKLLVLASQMQDNEVGDGTNSVVIFAGELLAQAENLANMGLHTSDIVRGYEMAGVKAQELAVNLAIYEEKDYSKESAIKAAVWSAISACQYGSEEFLSGIIAKACVQAMPQNPKNFVVENVRICKIHGGSLQQSEVLPGMVINQNVHGSVKHKTGPKVAIFNESFDSKETDTKGTVRLNSADELMQYNFSEEKFIEGVVNKLKGLGVSVVVSGGKFGEMALHFLDKNDIMAVSVSSKHELRRLSQCVRARMLVSLTDFTADDLGYADEVSVKEYGNQLVTVFNRDKEKSQIATIVLRASTENTLNDIERSLEDGINVVKALTRDTRFVPGAGAFEIELARLLGKYGEKCSGLEQYSVKKFAEALEVFPRTLSENAGLNATEMISKLYAAHEKGESRACVDITRGDVGDAKSLGILDLLHTKVESLRLAVNAVTTILKVDQIIMSKPAGGPRMGQQRSGHWDDED